MVATGWICLTADGLGLDDRGVLMSLGYPWES